MSGLHHVTAISGAADRNLAFYSDLLGLKLIKRTVNFDDPGTWHLYFGNAAANPGSIVTFFPWQHAAAGKIGGGETVQTRLSVPKGSLDYWKARLPDAEIREGRLAFRDPDGMQLALEANADGEGTAPASIAGVKLAVADPASTGAILAEVLGFKDEGHGFFTSPSGHVELEATHMDRGRLGRGSVHHIAFRAKDDGEQQAMVRKLQNDFGIEPTGQKDRNYFRSVYFREPSGVIFEIATDGPGFAVDEPADRLGESLKLPDFLEPRRAQIEASLAPLTGDA